MTIKAFSISIKAMRLLSIVAKILQADIAYAHCDIPCGIYDPTPAQIAAHTVLRMTQLFEASFDKDSGKPREHDIARIVHVKEHHGKIVEEELGTLKNDFFKPEHYEANPTLKDLIADAVKLSITTRQKVDMKAAQDLIEKVLQISEIFYKTKNVKPVRVKSLYPTEGEIVTHTA